MLFLSQYGLSRVGASNFATFCVLAGSLLRPLGGHLADRFGGVRMLTGLYLVVGATMFGMATLPPLFAGTLLLFAAMAAARAWATGLSFSSCRSDSPTKSA